MSSITVLKLDHQGRETWRYAGRVLERGESHVVLEALFNRADTAFHGILLKRGDRFVEYFFTDRWYNIFEMHDRDDGRLKGWYCNVGCPAALEDDTISYIDLALDVLVFPDGSQLVLDEEEFEALPLEPDVRRKAIQGLHELQTLLRGKEFSGRQEEESEPGREGGPA
jgi:uncharacterized protein